MTAKFAPPLQSYVVSQEFGHLGHKGIDLAIDEGNPVAATGNGVVSRIGHCSKCTDEKPNFISQGILEEDEAKHDAALHNEKWGFGFGNFVVVRYAWADLPDMVRDELNHRDMSNGFAYVIHAHLKKTDAGIMVGTGVNDGTVLGESGNTGNSTGPHLHLEVRLSTVGNAVSTGRFPSINPRIMYEL